jgi:hypothetical protein
VTPPVTGAAVVLDELTRRALCRVRDAVLPPGVTVRTAALGVDAENGMGAVALYARVGTTVAERRDTWEHRP